MCRKKMTKGKVSVAAVFPALTLQESQSMWLPAEHFREWRNTLLSILPPRARLMPFGMLVAPRCHCISCWQQRASENISFRRLRPRQKQLLRGSPEPSQAPVGLPDLARPDPDSCGLAAARAAAPPRPRSRTGPAARRSRGLGRGSAGHRPRWQRARPSAWPAGPWAPVC